MKKKWTYKKCYEEALKYDNVKDFYTYSLSVYSTACRNGWRKDYYWLKREVPDNGQWLIYAYEDPDKKVVYVGLTNNMNNRHSKHKCGLVKNGVRKFDVLAKYWQSIGKPLPRPRIKMESIDTEEDAQYYEDWYKQKYAETGWRVLNIGPTGIGKSSIGGCNRKWTEKTLREEIERLGCNSRGDFQYKNKSAYSAALDLGIIEKLFPETIFKEKGYWKKLENHIKEKEDNKCQFRIDYKNRCPGAYSMAIEYGFIDILFPEIKPKTWTEDLKKRMSFVRKGKNKGADNYKSTPVLMIDKTNGDTIKEFDSIHAAGEYLGDMKKQGNIWKCITGKIKSAYGYKWEYKKAG